MMQGRLSVIRVVLVGPLYPVNIGSVCRVMKNFSARELFLISPKTPINHEAIKYAKHAKDILDKAKIVDSLDFALTGMDYVIGTTGVVPRFGYALKSCVSPKEMMGRFSKKDRIALVLGNEGTGLSLSDLQKCDLLVSIPAVKRYGVLNLSHACAIVLYELFFSKKRYSHYRHAKRSQVKFLEKMFSETIGGFGEIRDKKKVWTAFSNVLGRARPSDEELQALFVAFGGIRKRLNRKPPER
ncbi:MAG: TrmJ/YjtD family RNA methyltransferase [Candidatus Micrarchaeota archaeon]